MGRGPFCHGKRTSSAARRASLERRGRGQSVAACASPTHSRNLCPKQLEISSVTLLPPGAGMRCDRGLIARCKNTVQSACQILPPPFASKAPCVYIHYESWCIHGIVSFIIAGRHVASRSFRDTIRPIRKGSAS